MLLLHLVLGKSTSLLVVVVVVCWNEHDASIATHDDEEDDDQLGLCFVAGGRIVVRWVSSEEQQI